MEKEQHDESTIENDLKNLKLEISNTSKGISK